MLTRASDLEPEYLILGLLDQEPGHGYRLHQRISEEHPGLWAIPQNQVYNILKRLEVKRHVVVEVDETRRGITRRTYSLTESGKRRFKNWRNEPSPPSARALRLAFLTRLRFARAVSPELALKLINDQEETIRADIDQLKHQARVQGDVDPLVKQSQRLRVQQLNTVLAWIQELHTELDL
jgi:DNA-binding PadR family transcriptional regulator